LIQTENIDPEYEVRSEITILIEELRFLSALDDIENGWNGLILICGFYKLVTYIFYISLLYIRLL